MRLRDVPELLARHVRPVERNPLRRAHCFLLGYGTRFSLIVPCCIFLPMERRLLVLGAGRHQKDLIRRAEARGLRVVASDSYPDAPGKAFASYPEQVDALAVDANIALARKHGVQGVITSGTDLALVTMADVAAALGLPCYLTPEAARTATHKSRMAHAFAAHGVPRAPWRETRRLAEAAKAAEALGFPVVVKPADSQGQRGTRVVSGSESLERAVAEALGASRSGCAMVEPFVEGWEVTASAWAKGGDVRIQMLTDRVTYNPRPAIGICFQHIYPSLRAVGLRRRIHETLQRVARCYGVNDAPLYVQMIVNGRGEIFVVEAACRVGGGHESSLTPVATGVDVLDRLIDLALDGRSAPIDDAHDETGSHGHALVNFLLARPGTVAALEGFEALLRRHDILEGEYYIRPGHECLPIADGQARVGYFIARAASRAALLERSAAAYRALSILDASGRNLLFIPGSQELLG
ncbi:MAG TPA: ATP-grasp domain-containing protein [Burkholderiales bacterium]